MTPKPSASKPSRPATDASGPAAMDDHLCFAVYSAGLAFNRVYRPLLAELGLTYPQYLVMVILWSGSDETVSSISDKLFLDSGTVTPLLKRLQVAGLVQRVRDTGDQRCVRIHLTETGEGLRQRALDLPEAVITAAGGDNPANKALRNDLLKLRSALLKKPAVGV